MNSFISISDARAKLPDLVEKVSKGLQRFNITIHGQPKVVVMSLEELEAIEETAGILSTPGAKKELLEGLKQAKQKKGIPLSKLK